MSDDAGTVSSLQYVVEPLTLEKLEAAVAEVTALAGPACGSDADHPHVVPTDKVGELVRCAVCGKRLVAMMGGRGLLFDLPSMMRSPLSLLVPPEPAENAFAYMALEFEGLRARMHRFAPIYTGFDLSVGYDPIPRRWRPRNLTRSTARTDFGRLLP